MIKSQFVLDILDLLLDGEDAESIRPQLDYISNVDYNYTDGSGCFISFSLSDNITRYRSNSDLILNGVKIESAELEIGADATLFMKGGVLDYLEIWSFDGNYPNTELKTYKLSQVWLGSPQRIIER